jgi:hypothetical protein
MLTQSGVWDDVVANARPSVETRENALSTQKRQTRNRFTYRSKVTPIDGGEIIDLMDADVVVARLLVVITVEVKLRARVAVVMMVEVKLWARVCGAALMMLGFGSTAFGSTTALTGCGD